MHISDMSVDYVKENQVWEGGGGVVSVKNKSWNLFSLLIFKSSQVQETMYNLDISVVVSGCGECFHSNLNLFALATTTFYYIVCDLGVEGGGGAD